MLRQQCKHHHHSNWIDNPNKSASMYFYKSVHK